MVRKLGRLAVGSLVCGFACVFTVGVFAAEDKPTDISTIMKKGHQGKTSYLNKIKDGVKAEKWDDIAKITKELKQFGEDLGKNKPEKGEADSWKKLSGEYKKNTAAVAAGVEKKDAKAVNEALGAIGKSCAACHNPHK